jgi:hypothetical protein
VGIASETVVGPAPPSQRADQVLGPRFRPTLIPLRGLLSKSLVELDDFRFQYSDCSNFLMLGQELDAADEMTSAWKKASFISIGHFLFNRNYPTICDARQEGVVNKSMEVRMGAARRFAFGDRAKDRWG